ncbi:hypothetical protein BpHYR1_028135 [Brachionus plicatilis]|uniref:Uncharacterized protein n=1 Tax=Brachionus plicatilis TaxID=10195 RepID=A0A3M7PNE6_BRAPC|nr:hypothetical protein BpHYR1_028135 [Brachionus plicatilis]
MLTFRREIILFNDIKLAKIYKEFFSKLMNDTIDNKYLQAFMKSLFLTTSHDLRSNLFAKIESISVLLPFNFSNNYPENVIFDLCLIICLEKSYYQYEIQTYFGLQIFWESTQTSSHDYEDPPIYLPCLNFHPEIYKDSRFHNICNHPCTS